MAYYQWTDADGTGDFGDASNWRNEYTFGSGVPGAQDDADVDANGTISGTGAVSGISFEGQLTADGLSLTADYIALNVGSIALTNGAEFVAFSQINESGDTTVTVSGDSLMAVLGTNPSSIGLDIGVEQGYPAVLDLTGYGTNISIEEDNTDIGDTGIGLMTISGGAELDTYDFYDDGGGALILGNSAGAQGTLTVSGAYSALDAGGPVTVGETGSGYLVIEAGAEASMNTGLGYFRLTIGDQAGSTGTLLVTGPGSRLDAYVNSPTIVGNDGTGSLTVTNHGFVELGYTVVDYDDGNGSIAVTGTGSTLEMRYGLELGGDVATGGTGVLSVSAGAQTVVIGGGIALGYAADTAGTISVSGAHSTLNIGTNEVDVGIDGTGTLLVTGGGLVKATGISQGIILGADDQSGSSGYALVSGAGSDIVDTGAFTVGGLGTGTLTIAAGGRVSAASLATSEFATAAISLSGVGSALAVSGIAQFGGAAATSVSIGSGSVLSPATAVVANAAVSLTGGTLSATRTLTVDGGQAVSGSGTVKAASLINAGTIGSGGGTLSFIGKISGAGTLAVGATSSLSLSGAVGSGQTALFQAATGTLALVAPTQFAAAIEDFVHGDTIDLSGIVATRLSFAGHKLTVHESNGSSLGLIFSGAYSQASFAAPASDQHGGTLITHT